ncbi:hypothetical protein F6X86_08375 [Enterococcus durans]|uniref:Uncharacterized protein n=2 Tax=Enterococcus durans TaxID=53345 RepID=A0A5N0Z0D1_9ENTE|nr:MULTISPECIES: hypothetical protein [Enterococcus]KAA9178507.1 hypothetical protein F6X86_08375 [Enterococcus durans]KAA9186965.1 hypothetical protein F6X85_04910 [Enterococcus durans]KAA9187081.1 hypothetical protein F6X90_04635 [Enterococcus durans]KAA9192948.1 hypothetical protein F6Y12_03910 [Enterococcus durans]KAA9195093.1 hypothetical protein F6X88_03145 [Enterococcus durans]
MRGLVPQALKILNERFTLTEINPEMIPKSTYEGECFNALVSMKNTQKLSWMELHVKVYQIKRETASELYFSVGQSHFNPIPSLENKEELLLVFVEEQVDYFHLNCVRLFLEIYVAIGVTEKDRQEKNDWYLEYQHSKELLDNFHLYTY